MPKMPGRIKFLFAVALFVFCGVFATASNAADLIAYYNFEGTATSPFPVNATSHAPAFFDGADAQHSSTLVATNLSMVTAGYGPRK